MDGKNISIPTMHLLRRGLFVDIRDGSWTSGTCVAALANASAASGKPGVVVSNFSGVNHAVMASDAIAAGLPVIEGTVSIPGSGYWMATWHFVLRRCYALPSIQ